MTGVSDEYARRYGLASQVYTDRELGIDCGTCEECGGDGCESCRCERCLQALEGGECPACGDVDE